MSNPNPIGRQESSRKARRPWHFPIDNQLSVRFSSLRIVGAWALPFVKERIPIT